MNNLGLIKNKSSKLLVEAAQSRGLKVTCFAKNLFLCSGEGREELFSIVMSGSNSHVAKKVVLSKHLTKIFLERRGVPTPRGVAFERKSMQKAFKLLEGGGRFVLKPSTSDFGRYVFMGISSEGELEEKLSEIPLKYNTMMFEEQVSGVEARYLVVGDEVVAVAERKPASVTGDGVNSIAELVEKKASERKGHLALKGVKIDSETLSLLQEQGYSLDDSPELGVKVLLKRVSNISQGGDSVDITDSVHDSLKELAVSAVKAIPGLIYSGVDIIVENHFAPRGGQKPVVLEVNWDPMIRLHHAPETGKARDVAGAIIDELFFNYDLNK
ncbi:hypothetical protein [Halomonas mongoliensis]|uniref:hypothetical protein n=1 Tax=Halomonas mongoliensis TaxID=321265 RepID=UPI00403ACC8B